MMNASQVDMLIELGADALGGLWWLAVIWIVLKYAPLWIRALYVFWYKE